MQVEPGSHAAPGSVAALLVHARNLATAAQDLTFSAIGLEGEWLPTPLEVPALAPDASVSVELALTPPAGAAPGDYPFVVVVQAESATGRASGPPATTLVDASVRVDGVSELVLTVEPADTRAVRSRPIHVVLANTGELPAHVTLRAGPNDEADVDVTLESDAVDVAPHSSVRLPGRARVARPRLVGAERRIPYHVTATGSRAPQRFDASVTARPVFTSGVLRLVAVAMVAVLWVGAVLAALPWISDRMDPSRDVVVAQDGPAGPDGVGPDGQVPGAGPDGQVPGAGPDGAGPDGGAPGDGPAAPTEPAAPAPGVRIAGVVTSGDPAGVTVQVVPATTLSPPPVGGPANAAGTGVAVAATLRGVAASWAGPLGPWGALGAVAAVGGLVLAAVSGPLPALGTASGSWAEPGSLGVLGALGSPAGLVARQAPEAPAGKLSALALPVERTDLVSQRRTTVTGEDGTWAFGGLSPTGRYLIVLAKPGYQTQRIWVTGAQAAAAPLELAMVPGPGRMSGTVTGPGGPAGGVEITLTDGTTTVTTRTVTSGRVGFWEVDGLSTPSTYLVTASSDRLGAESALVRLAADGERTVSLQLRSGLTTLTGTVTGTDSLGGTGGLGGITVTATSGDVSRTATTVTGPMAGTFVLPDLPVPNTYILTASGEGYATLTREIVLTEVGVSPLLLTLTALGGTVSGSVTNEDGAGLPAVGLTLDGPAGTYKTMSASDATGSFLFVGIAPGSYVLTAEVFGYEPGSTQVEVVSGRPASADLVLRRLPGDGLVATSVIRGRVTDASTGARITCPKLLPGETCELTVTTEARRADGSVETISVTAGPDEAYQIPASTEEGLYPGSYRLILEAPGYEPGRVDVTVPMGQVVEAATVALFPSPSIVGSVSARVGIVPTETCVVAVVQGQPPPDPSAPCQPDPGGDACEAGAGDCSFVGLNGSYQIDRLRAGAYDVYVFPPPDGEFLVPPPVSVILTPGDVRRLDATLDRLGVLTLTVFASDGAGAVFPANSATVRLTAPGIPDIERSTDAEGFVQIRSLAAATYTIEATSFTGNATGSLPPLAVGLNQDIQAQVVLTAPVADVRLRVVTFLGGAGNAATPVGGAEVTVSGITGYRGVAPIRSTGTPVATTDADGWMEVCAGLSCATDPWVTVLPLVEARIDLRARATGYIDHVANDVETATLGPIALTPMGRPFVGTISLNQTADPAPLYSQVRFDVIDAPPGVGQIGLTIDNGQVIWSDSAQPPDGPGRMIRPGFYTIAASLPGYDTDVREFFVPPGTAAFPPVAFSLNRHGFLRIAVVAEGEGSTEVFDAVATLTLPGGAAQRLEAHPGNSYIDFGVLPTGQYTVDVRAPGFRGFNGTVALAPGQEPTSPTVVALTRLGTIVGGVRTAIVPGVSQAISGATVTATQGAQSFTATTGTNGRYSVTGTTLRDGLTTGNWGLSAVAAGHAEGGAVSAFVPAPAPGSPFPPTMTVEAPDILLTPNPGELVIFALSGDEPVNGLQMSLTYRDALFTIQRTPDCTPGGVGQPSTCPGTNGVYVFYDLLPLTYNLNISGASYSPLTLPVEMSAGQTRQLTVPVTVPSSSVQGVVTLQQANGTSVPVVGATVTLAGDGVEDRVAETDADGRYRFSTVTPGLYTVSVTADGRTATRSVALQPGEGVVVDLVLQEETHALTVLVTTNGADLTGALVSLSGPGAPPAPQPVVRQSGNTYATSFAQLPAGTWTVQVSGPAGQLGVFQATVDLPDDDQVTFTLTLTQVRLRAVSEAAAAPATITATVTPQGGAARDLLVAVGGNETIVWIPDDGAQVTAVVPGWDVTVTPAAVPAGVASQLVTITVSARPTTIDITTAPAATVVQGANVTVGVLVRPTTGGGTVGAGTVVLQRNAGAGVWEDVSPVTTVSAAGAASLTASTADWPPGANPLRVAYSGAGAFASSTAVAGTVAVEAPTTAALAYADGTLTATVTPTGATAGPPTGAVAFQQQTGATWTAITGCGAVALADGSATCAFAPTAAATARTVFTGSGIWADSTSGTVAVPAAAADGDG